MRINIASKEVIHFVGIGGIGMSGLAQIMHNMGFKVQGSDITQNKNIDRLKKFDIKIFTGHRKQNIKNATMLVISSAIKKNNVEYFLAKRKRLPIFKRGDMLANIVSLKKNIVVTGSHGKTTTTSLISNILYAAKLDPTIINGGVINFLKNSAKLGKSDWSVLESDESDGSFLKIPSTYSVVTNIDKEHLDYYKKFNFLQKSFQLFVEKTPSFGKSIICRDDYNNKKLISNLNVKNYLTYGFDKDSNFQIKGGYEYTEYANNETFLVVQIETIEGLEAANEIASTEGVDCIFIGTGDLGLRINKYGHKLNIEESIEKIAKAAKDHNKAWGRPVINKEDIKLLYAQGALLIAYGNDLSILKNELERISNEIDSIINE